MVGDVSFLDLRIDEDDGQLLAIVRLARTVIPRAWGAPRNRGDRGLYERMDHVREPARRPASIALADLEASGTSPATFPPAATSHSSAD